MILDVTPKNVHEYIAYTSIALARQRPALELIKGVSRN
jgi:hypothetical protein